MLCGAQLRGGKMLSPKEHNWELKRLRGHTDENNGLENLLKKKKKDLETNQNAA